MVDQGVYDRPKWLTAVERAPPLELHSLQCQARRIHNPYPNMVLHLLKKYPDLRFQDCFVDGNDWSKGNDRYRDDHPAMQFVARQLRLMNEKGYSRKKAFKETEKWFYGLRMELEKRQKILMAQAASASVEPLFTSGQAYWQTQIAEEEDKHLQNIIVKLRENRLEAEGKEVPRHPSPGITAIREAFRDRGREAVEGEGELSAAAAAAGVGEDELERAALAAAEEGEEEEMEYEDIEAMEERRLIESLEGGEGLFADEEEELEGIAAMAEREEREAVDEYALPMAEEFAPPTPTPTPPPPTAAPPEPPEMPSYRAAGGVSSIADRSVAGPDELLDDATPPPSTRQQQQQQQEDQPKPPEGLASLEDEQLLDEERGESFGRFVKQKRLEREQQEQQQQQEKEKEERDRDKS
uniref:Small ribosomal subunit protein mS23 n=1 Tax=Vitrella brassicaformis TaxID=1169539 RepID=A0A7S1P697_9ALVE